jgi:peptidyl-prolyl cis-trans isomerase D
MLQNLGDKIKHNRLLTALLGVLAIVFAFWGAAGVVNFSFTPPDFGLQVNGEGIDATTVDKAWQERQSQYAQAQGGAEMSAPQKAVAQQQVIDDLVRDAVLRQRAQAGGYRVSDQQVLTAYQQEPAFQVDGKFNATVARAMLVQVGLTPESYEAERRQALQISQLTGGIELSDFLTATDVLRIYALENEQREVRYALLPLERFAAQVAIDPPAIKAWYDAHPADYQSPESVRLQYAELRLDAIAAQITVAPADLQAYYDKNKAHFSEDDKRHAHHILIPIAAPKDAAADAAALATATQVLAELKAGKDFGELARKYSADPGSASQGGDLGWGDRSTYVAPFSEALFKLEPGQISDPVKTQFGYHIIRLDEIRAAHVRSLEDSHAEIEAQYRHDQASELFGDRQEQLQQKIENGQTNDLPALAKEFGLQLGEVQTFTHSGGAPLDGKSELVAAVFEPDALAGKRVGGPVAMADDRLVIFKVLEHRAPASEPLASVQAQVIAAIRNSEGTKAARAAADAAVKRLEGGENTDAVFKSLGVASAPAAFVARSDPQLPAQLRQLAFTVPQPTAGKPAYRALSLDRGGAALLVVSAVKPGTAGTNATNDQQLLEQYQKRDREAELDAYEAALMHAADVRRNPKVFE